MRRRRYIALFIFSSIMFIFLLITNLVLGSVDIPLKEIFKIFFHHSTDSTLSSILWKIRFPRILFASLSGAYLSVGGLLLQVFFRNPIVGPYVLGISAGATLMVGLVMLLGISMGVVGINPFYISLAAAFGAFCVTTVLILFSTKVKDIVTLLVIGLMMGYLCYALTSIFITFAAKEKVKGFVLWQMGSFSGVVWEDFRIIFFSAFFLTILLGIIKKPLNAFLLGEEYAKTMGVNIKVLRNLIVIISSILAGLVTAFAGPVAFIGIAVPHIARLSFKTSDNGILIPASAILGANVTLVCDLLARMLLSPIELPISAITALFGAPTVIFLLLKKRTTI